MRPIRPRVLGLDRRASAPEQQRTTAEALRQEYGQFFQPSQIRDLALSMALVGSYVGASRLLVAVLPIFLLAWLRFGIAAVAMAHWVRRQPTLTWSKTA